MKAVAVIFLFICATEASRNWAGVPKTDLSELDSLLKGNFYNFMFYK